jgi:hypothetical protein
MAELSWGGTFLRAKTGSARIIQTDNLFAEKIHIFQDDPPGFGNPNH